jgi:hypothetical protein
MVSFKQTKMVLFKHEDEDGLSMVSFILFLRDAWMKMARDEWVRAVMTDDTVVVELLVGLKQSQAALRRRRPRPPQNPSSVASSSTEPQNQEFSAPKIPPPPPPHKSFSGRRLCIQIEIVKNTHRRKHPDSRIKLSPKP